jgi:hypothetical protein
MAMMESQRYPADFDGIIAGAPANDYRPDNLIWIQHRAFSPIRSILPAYGILLPGIPPFLSAKLALVESSVIDACDGADGLVDGPVDAPQYCPFGGFCRGGWCIPDGTEEYRAAASTDITINCPEGFGHFDIVWGAHSLDKVHEPLLEWMNDRLE